MCVRTLRCSSAWIMLYAKWVEIIFVEAFFLSSPSGNGRAELLRTEISGRFCRHLSFFRILKFFWRIFLTYFLTNLLTNFLTNFLKNFFDEIIWRNFFDKFFDKFFDIFEDFFWQIFWRKFDVNLTNFLRNFLTNFLDEFFRILIFLKISFWPLIV